MAVHDSKLNFRVIGAGTKTNKPSHIVNILYFITQAGSNVDMVGNIFNKKHSG